MKLSVLSIFVIVGVHWSHGVKSMRCCQDCPFYHGLMIEPGCDECGKDLFLTVGQQVEIRCSPCNATFSRAIQRIKGGTLFWNASNLTIETRTSATRSVIKIESNRPHVDTISCLFGNRTRVEFEAQRNVIVCGKLEKPTLTCTTSNPKAIDLVLNCSWKLPDHVDIGAKYGLKTDPVSGPHACNLDYGNATLVYIFEDHQFEEHIRLKNENENRSCGVHDPCVIEPICMRPECANGRLMDYIRDGDGIIRIQATSPAEKPVIYDFPVPPLNSILVQNDQPFLKSRGPHSCTISIKTRLPSPILFPQFNNSKFLFYVKATNGGRLIRDDSEPLIVPVKPESFGIISTQIDNVIDGLFPGQTYEMWVSYRLEGSNHKTKPFYLECHTVETEPVAIPRIPPGGYMLVDGYIKLYPEEVPKDYQGAQEFRYEATLDGQPKIESSSTPISIPFDSNTSDTVVLRLRNKIGYAKQNFILKLDPDTLRMKSNVGSSRKLMSTDPSISRYFVSWSGVPSVTSYVLYWCQEQEICHRVPKWTKLEGQQENAIVCLDSRPLKFFISACTGDLCGPMVMAPLKEFAGPKKLQIQTQRPALDSSESSVTLSWDPPSTADQLGFISSYQIDFDTDGDLKTIHQSKKSIPCDQIGNSARNFSVRLIMKMKPLNSPRKELICSGREAREETFFGDWSSLSLSPDLCHVSNESSMRVLATLAFLLSVLSILGLMGLVYFGFERMAKKYLDKMMEMVNRVERLYPERQAAKEDKDRVVEEWFLEKYGAPPQYTIVNVGSKGEVRLPYLPQMEEQIGRPRGRPGIRQPHSLPTASGSESGSGSGSAKANIYTAHNPAFSGSTPSTSTWTGSTVSRQPMSSDEADSQTCSPLLLLTARSGSGQDEEDEGTTVVATNDGYKNHHFIEGETGQ